MSLNVQRSRQGATYERVFTKARYATGLTLWRTARPASWLVGLIALLPDPARIRAELPQPDSNPRLTSGQTTAPAEEETKPYKKLSLEELVNIEVNTVSRTESTVGQSVCAD